MKRLFLFSLLMLCTIFAGAKISHLLPKPQQLTVSDDEPFALARAIVLDDKTDTWLLRNVLETNGCTIQSTAEAVVKVEITSSLGTFNHSVPDFPDEGYQLSVSENLISIKAATETGVIRAAQTLQQLAEGYDGTPAIEAVEITDFPAFKVRGYMHDVGRSFITVDELINELRLFSRFKVNVFHWHLTENQAWRFEVKSHPELTAASSMTRYAGSFYTQAECARVDSIAHLYGITVIPEIDMPGHSAAFKRATGYDMQTDAGVATLKEVLAEACAVFKNAPYIHIGGDEVTITYAGFLQTLSDVVKAQGKKVVCWNRLVSGAPSTAYCDMTQMWATAGKAVAGIPNIDCRYNYTNHFDVFADLVGIYKSNVYYQQRGTTEAAGLISAPWNDRKSPTQEAIIRQNNIYAVTIASAERAWMGGGSKYIEEGGTTLPNSGEEYEAFKDWETRFLFHKAHSLAGEPIPYVKQTNVHWRISDPFPNGGDASKAFPPEECIDDVLPSSFSYGGSTYGTTSATGAGIYLNHTWGNTTIPTLFGKTVPATNQTAYAWTYVYSPEEQTVGAQIEFYNYGRSEVDRAPESGKWDRYGSSVWLNGEAIAPPEWLNAGRSISQEVDLQNENFTMRDPVRVTLKKGWNKVLLKLPYNPDGTQRLKKWMFTFVFTDTEGRNAVEGLVYSPDKILDEMAQQVSALIGQAKALRDRYVGDEVGFYPEEIAFELNQVVEQIEPTLSETLDEATRNGQAATLSEAIGQFENQLTAANLIKPNRSNADTLYCYYLCTPLRDNLYATSQGVGGVLTGKSSPDDDSKWLFMRRTANTFNIVNYADGGFISPASSNNTAIRTAAARPSSAWVVKPADEPGYVIICSGSNQLNQTTAAHSFQLFNWGDGTNTSDTGCKFRIEAADLIVTGLDQAAARNDESDHKSYFSLDGKRQIRPQRGVNIVKSANTTQKVLYK